MTEIARTARCACGQLTAATMGEPARSLICSCDDCHRKSGSGFNWSTYWPEHAVAITGESKSFRRASQGGRSLEYHFCPDCGVGLWWRADFATGLIGIAGGNFDAPLPPPTRAYWSEFRPDWCDDIAGIPALRGNSAWPRSSSTTCARILAISTP